MEDRAAKLSRPFDRRGEFRGIQCPTLDVQGGKLPQTKQNPQQGLVFIRLERPAVGKLIEVAIFDAQHAEHGPWIVLIFARRRWDRLLGKSRTLGQVKHIGRRILPRNGIGLFVGIRGRQLSGGGPQCTECKLDVRLPCPVDHHQNDAEQQKRQQQPPMSHRARLGSIFRGVAKVEHDDENCIPTPSLMPLDVE